MSTVMITFDCGRGGKVAWEAPSKFFVSGLTDREMNELTQEDFGQVVELFFRLIGGLNVAGARVRDQGISEIGTSLLAVAKRTQDRL